MESEDNCQQFDNSTCSAAPSGSNKLFGESKKEEDQKSHRNQSLQPKQSIDEDHQAPQDANASEVEENHDSSAETTTAPSQNASSHEIKPIGTSDKTNTDVTNSEDFDNNSDTSEFSDFSEESWHPVQGPIAWVQEQMKQGHSPRKILEDLVPTGTLIPEGLDPIMLWKIIINIVSEPPKRDKLDHINTLDDIIHLLKTSKKIMVLTGAGVSVSCGIPDFRSRDGVYARLSVDFPNLPDPQAMFDIHFFRNDPRPFFKFAKEIFPGQFHPSPCHHFIRMLESKGKLLRNYTQNIDTLEQVAGIERVIQCHGSFATATCAECGLQVNSDIIKEDIFKQVIPLCSRCPHDDERAVMKPDIVFFGESLPEDFHNQMAADKDECDLLIVIGSSLKVRPVALIPNSLPAHVPQILINRESLHYLSFDVELLGNCDDIVGDLCRRLGEGWEQLASPGPPLKEIDMSSLPTPPVSLHSQDSCPSTPEKKTTDVNPENNNVQSTDTSHTNHSHHLNPDKCVDSDNKDSESHTEGQTSASETTASLAEDHNSSTTSSHQSDSSSNLGKTGSINCGILPHHNQDVMFCPSKGAPHTLSRQQIVKCSSDGSQTSSGGQSHHIHYHHHSEKRKSDSCEEANEPSTKHQKLEEDTEQWNEPGVSSDTAEVKLSRSPEADCSIDDIRKMWQRKRRRVTLAQRLLDDQVLFLPPSRYVFKGAEVFSDFDGDISYDSSSDDSCDEEEDPDIGEPSSRKEGSEAEEQTETQDDTAPPHPNTTLTSTCPETAQLSTSAIDPALGEEPS